MPLTHGNSFHRLDRFGPRDHNEALVSLALILNDLWILSLMLKNSELDEFKTLLLKLRARVRGDVQQLTDEALDRNSGAGDSKSPTHLADLGTDANEQDFALRVVENDEELLGEIKAALGRIKDETFGLCENCQAEGKSPSKSVIPKTRLRAIPFARECIGCKRKREELTL